MAFSCTDSDKDIHQISIRSCGWEGVSHLRNLEQVLDFSSPTFSAESVLQSVDATDFHLFVSPRCVKDAVYAPMPGTIGEARVGLLAHSRFVRNIISVVSLREAAELCQS